MSPVTSEMSRSASTLIAIASPNSTAVVATMTGSWYARVAQSNARFGERDS